MHARYCPGGQEAEVSSSGLNQGVSGLHPSLRLEGGTLPAPSGAPGVPGLVPPASASPLPHSDLSPPSSHTDLVTV